VIFTASTGTLALTAPGSFSAGPITGFAGNDVIDLVGTQATGLSYSGSSTTGTLTVSGGGPIASLSFNGDYTTASFTAVSDGHGGTDIIDPPAGPKTALLGNYMSSTFPAVGNGSVGTIANDQTNAPQFNLVAHV
jgi:hypothetical protein